MKLGKALEVYVIQSTFDVLAAIGIDARGNTVPIL